MVTTVRESDHGEIGGDQDSRKQKQGIGMGDLGPLKRWVGTSKKEVGEVRLSKVVKMHLG